MNSLALKNLRTRISKGRWRKEKCPCGQKGCHSWNVRPIIYGQGILSEEADADMIEMAPELLDEVLELRELVALLEEINKGIHPSEEKRLRRRHLYANCMLRAERSCATCGHRECADRLDKDKQNLKGCGDWRQNTGKALFRHHRYSLEDSMKTVIDVECLDDIPLSEGVSGPLTCENQGFDVRTHWNTHAVRDASGFAIGFTNKMLKTREELAKEK